MKKELEEFLLKAISAAEKTGEFIADEAPDLVNNFLLYHTILNSVVVVLSVILSIGIYKLAKNAQEEDIFDDSFYFYLVSLFQIIPIMTFVVFVIRLLKVLLVPKLYLIDHLINSL